MEWMSRTDDEFLKTKELFIDFCMKMIKVATEDERFDLEQYHNSPEVTQAYIHFSQWMRSDLHSYKNSSRINDLLQSPAKRTRTKTYFGKIFFQSLFALTSCYRKSKHVACLKGGLLVQLPSLARAGDLVLRQWLAEGADWTIARPCEAGLSYDGELLPKMPLKQPGRRTDSGQQIHSCSFVTSVSDDRSDLFRDQHDIMLQYRSLVDSKREYDAKIYAFH